MIQLIAIFFMEPRPSCGPASWLMAHHRGRCYCRCAQGTNTSWSTYRYGACTGCRNANHCHRPTVLTLLLRGAQADDGTTALMVAAERGRLATVKCLLERGQADVRVVDSSGASALVLAKRRANNDQVRCASSSVFMCLCL